MPPREPDQPSRQARLPFQRIVDDLRADILEGRLRPGEQIPTVQALCDSYGVSKVTVLKALSVLRGAGLIKTVPRWGSFVTDNPGKAAG
jgi:DNA-binding GntR family transcriptional regulator